MYLLTRIPALQGALVFVTCGIGMALLVALMVGATGYMAAYDDSERDEYKRILKIAKKITCAFAVSLSVTILVPSSKDLAVIYLGDWISHNEAAKQLPEDILSALHKLLAGDLPEQKSPENSSTK